MEETIELFKNAFIWVSELDAPLESIVSDSESSFVKLGEDLQSVYSEAEGLERLALETAEMINPDANGKLLSEIRDLAGKSLERLERFRTEVIELFPRFESCISQMTRLNEKCPGIIKLARTLNMISFNISTESARSAKCEEMFRIFVKEIRELAKKVNDISHKIKEGSEDSKKIQQDEFKRMTDRSNKLNVTADLARETVMENIRRIDEAMQMSVPVLQKLGVHSQKVSGLAGEIVGAIQFHDIAKQQIEHVRNALSDLKSSIRETGISGDDEEQCSILLGKTHSILKLQALQLKQVVLEIGNIREKITNAFFEIGRETEALVDDAGRTGADNPEMEKQESAFNMLASGFSRLKQILENGEELAQEIDETMKKTSTSASDLFDYLAFIEDVSTDLHLKSINALIMSKKLGQGGITLSVLAQYVTEVSKDSDEFVSEVIDILKSIQTSARNLNLVSFSELRERDARNAADSSIEEVVINLSESHNRFLVNMGLSRNHSMMLKTRISEIESDLTFLNDMKFKLEESLRRLEGHVDRLSRYSSFDQGAKEDLSKIQSRYTMHVERDIHRRNVDNRELIKKEPENKKHYGEGELGTNVELF